VFFSLFIQAAPQTPNSIVLVAAPYVLIGLVFYFLLFMPMQKQKKRTAEMLRQLKSGDNVVTSSGIVGTVTSVDGDTIILRVKPDNLKLQFARSAVSTLVPPEGSK
jgi:preprotein translocase subunit YajC